MAGLNAFTIDLDRLDACLKRVGLSRAGASRLVSPSGSPDIIRDIARKPDAKVSLHIAEGLAEVADCDLAYLRGMQDTPRQPGGRSGPSQGTVSLSDKELELIGVMRNAPHHMDTVLQLARNLRNSDPADEQGRVGPKSKPG